MQQQKTKRILFITLSNIGDAIMTTTVLQALHNIYPGKMIDIVSDKRSCEIFLNCPYRGDIFIKNKKSFLRGAPELLGKLWSRNYDLIVDLRTDGLAYFLRGKKILTRWHRHKTGRHSVQQHLGVIASVNTDNAPPRCHLWISNDDEQYARSVLGELTGKRILSLGPGANSQKKIWPAENYTGLIEKLAEDFTAVVLLGDKHDAILAKDIITPPGLAVLDLCGRTTILQAAAVLQHTNVFIGNDSGLGHIAAACGVPTVTLFGPGEPERYRPWSEKSQYVCGAGQDITNVRIEDVINCISMIGDKRNNT